MLFRSGLRVRVTADGGSTAPVEAEMERVGNGHDARVPLGAPGLYAVVVVSEDAEIARGAVEYVGGAESLVQASPERLRTLGLAYQPDLILYAYSLNDPQPFSLELQGLTAMERTARTELRPRQAILRWLSHSRPFLLVWRRWQDPWTRAVPPERASPAYRAAGAGGHSEWAQGRAPGARGGARRYGRGGGRRRRGELEGGRGALERARVVAPEAPRGLDGLATALQAWRKTPGSLGAARHR